MVFSLITLMMKVHIITAPDWQGASSIRPINTRCEELARIDEILRVSRVHSSESKVCI